MASRGILLKGVIFLFGWFLMDVNCQGPIVNTTYGQIMGNRNMYDGLFFEEFLGIPFAAPPVDALRWEKPQPPASWAPVVLNTTEFSIACTQLIIPNSGEDCLYLNVWVPNGVSANAGRQLPVMVWIHGGAYIFGTGYYYPGQDLALHGDMIVVNFNYRLTALGFLSTGDPAVPGNYGMWDVQAGLQWVQDNIQSFNGDPNQVTIFGQSAGGALTSHAVISPQTNTLFKNAIAISGGASGYFGIQNQPLRLAMQMSEIFNCSANNTQDIEDCLRQVGPHSLDFWGLVGNLVLDKRLPSFAPVVDGDFVQRPPRDSFELGEGNNVNFITGSVFHDAAYFFLIPLPPPNLAATNDSLIFWMRMFLGVTDNEDELIQMIFTEYPEMNTLDNDTRLQVATKAHTEFWFGSASNWEAAARIRTQATGKTFQYQFKHHQSFLDEIPQWVNGSHGDDIFSIFGPPFHNQTYNATDEAIMNNIQDYFTNFAHTGDPNQGPYSIQPVWNQYNPAEENYLQESPTFSMQTFYEDNIVDRYRFWVDFPNHYVFPPLPTFSEVKEITEQDIDNAVLLLKEILIESIEDEEAQMELEDMIDGFMEDRRLGFPINS